MGRGGWLALACVAVGCGRVGYASGPRPGVGEPDAAIDGDAASAAYDAEASSDRDAAPDVEIDGDTADASADAVGDVGTTAPTCVPAIAQRELVPVGYAPNIVVAPSEIVMAWSKPSGSDGLITVSRFDRDGVALGADVDFGAGWDPSLERSGAGFMLAWTDYDYVWTSPLDAMAMPTAAPIQVSSVFGVVTDGPRLAGDGTTFGALWMSWAPPNRIAMAIFGSTGERTLPEIDVLERYSDPEATALAFNGRQFAGAWHNYTGEHTEFALVDRSGAVVHTAQYSAGWSAAIAWGDSWLLASPTMETGFDLMRIDETGAVTSTHRVATEGAVGEMHIVPGPLGDAVFHLMWFTDHREIDLVIVDRAGRSSDPVAIVDVPECISSFDVVADGDGYTLAWQRGGGPSSCGDGPIMLTDVECR